MLKRYLLLVMAVWSGCLLAQTDSIPRIVEGEFDWLKFKAKMNAPAFNQKDLVMYIARKEGYGQLFGDNPTQDWVYDFHFLNLDANPHLDGIFYGNVVAEEGPYTMLLMGDTTLSFPQKFGQRGYIHSFDIGREGLEFTFRRDAQGERYWSETGSWWYDFEQDSTWYNWRVLFVGKEAPSQTDRIKAFTLDAPTELRWSPEVDDKTPTDWDGDEKADAVGNIVGIFSSGAQLFRSFEKVTESGERWSFVILLNGASELRAFPKETVVGPGPEGAYIAGWLPTKALGRR